MRYLTAAWVSLLVLGVAVPAAAEEVVDPAPFESLLENYVDGEGRVDYAGMLEEDEATGKLETYLDEVGEADLEGHTDDEKLAFYLNAYNALTIGSILDEWPTDSPRSIKGFFKVREHDVAGREVTLDALEHEIVRKKFSEPRIHFVLVCAAASCPRLRRTALTGENVDDVLESAAEEFIPQVTALEDGSVVTSALFDWFSEDFVDAAGSVRDYLKKYVDGDVAEALEDEETDIEFREYDWSVNSQSEQ